MRKNLKLLDELQTIDLKNDGFSEEKEGLLNGLAELDAELIGGRDAVAAKKEELTFLNEEREKLEEGIAAEQDNIRRSEAHQKEIKTQKEYQAVSKEIAAAKKLGAELEEQLLQKIGQIDELTAAIAGIEETLMILEQQVNIRKNELQEKIDRLEAELDSGMVAREAIVKGLPASVTRRYGILREQRRGVAVVEAREGSCLGCNMQLPPQLYNTLFRADELILCPHCQRILILR
ncbi:MAG TPA: C4-type zinc ribbon domain-containing protein [Geobacteraceae bacterium]|nr:C4-type zinc ribbon domain-containing protein [Geobacteraceae bacterium]